MKFTIYDTAEEFSKDALHILNRNEIQNNLFYRNIADGMFLASVKDSNGNVIITIANKPLFAFLMYETDNIRNDEAVAFLAQSLFDNHIDVDMVSTEKALGRSFCGYYGKLSNKNYYISESLVLYAIDKVNDIAEANGVFRKARGGDMYYLPYWFADFSPACGLGDYDLDDGIEVANRAIENGTVYLWEDNYPVSMAANTRNTSDCAFIARVYTPPNLRANGYGTACVWNLTKKLLEDGYKYCALYANCANPYSNKVYQKIGYEQVFWYDQYKLSVRK